MGSRSYGFSLISPAEVYIVSLFLSVCLSVCLYVISYSLSLSLFSLSQSVCLSLSLLLCVCVCARARARACVSVSIYISLFSHVFVSNPCQNDGSSTNVLNNWTFACVLDYYGNDCETSMYICISFGLLHEFRVHIRKGILQIYYITMTVKIRQ